MYKALITFCGKLSMTEGEVKEIKDQALVKDLLACHYIEEIKDKPKRKTPKGE